MQQEAWEGSGAQPNTNILVRAPRDKLEADLEIFMLTFDGEIVVGIDSDA